MNEQPDTSLRVRAPRAKATQISGDKPVKNGEVANISGCPGFCNASVPYRGSRDFGPML